MDKQSDNRTFQQKLGSGMIVFAWIILLGLLTLYFNRFLRQQNNPNENVISTGQMGYHEVVLKRNRYGHYVATGQINGKSVDFMLDTGATNVSVPERLVEKLALQRGPVIRVNTANGTVNVYATVIDMIKLGDIELRDVRGSINPHMDSEEILMGMSFLKKLELVQKSDYLTLRQYK